MSIDTIQNIHLWIIQITIFLILYRNYLRDK